MKGEVLHYDDSQGTGYISGDDTNRYQFQRSDLQQLKPIGAGTRVDFRPDGDIAREIFTLAQNVQAGYRSSGGYTGSEETVEDNNSLWGYYIAALSDKYATFSGRARRKEYWSFILFYWLGMIALGFVGLLLDSAVGNLRPNSGAAVITAILLLPYLLGTIVPTFAVVIRRIHDLGLSGWFILLLLIPYLGGLIIFVMMLLPSEKGANRHGPQPLGD